jgi:hypothetical protein
MAQQPSGAVFASSIPYEATRINAAAVYCSDGRVGDHMDEFLHRGLGLPRYDRLACPGGPAALAGRLMAFWEARGVADQLRFLVGAHQIQQVVLIAHAGCAYYAERLGLGTSDGDRAQRSDLVAAAAAVQRIASDLDLAGYFAHVDGTQVSYERVFASDAMDARLRHPPGRVPQPTVGSSSPAHPTSSRARPSR